MAGTRITRADVEKVARLARLELTEAEVAKFAQQLGAVLDHFGELARLDTRDVPRAVQALPTTGSLRPDAVATGLDADDVVANAPAQLDGAFLVPRVVAAGKETG